MSTSDPTPKIIVDDDWKSQARAEKAKLSELDQKKAQEPKSGGIPENLTFTDLVQVMATQALSYLGAFPDPQTGKAMVALDVAKLHIDLLGVLNEKTKGNLTEEEDEILKGTLHELRLQFVEITKAITKAQAEGKLESMPRPGGMPGSGPLG